METALRLFLPPVAVMGELFRDEPIGVPVLMDPPIRKAAQDEIAGFRVERQNGLPDGEDPNPARGILLQDLLDCGGPPQAGRSGGRQEQHDPDGVRVGVEFRFQSRERRGVDHGEA